MKWNNFFKTVIYVSRSHVLTLFLINAGWLLLFSSPTNLIVPLGGAPKQLQPLSGEEAPHLSNMAYYTDLQQNISTLIVVRWYQEEATSYSITPALNNATMLFWPREFLSARHTFEEKLPTSWKHPLKKNKIKYIKFSFIKCNNVANYKITCGWVCEWASYY